MKNLFILIFSLITLSYLPNIVAHDLKGAIVSEDRTPKNVIRDIHRHPYETLNFFGITSDMTVVELSPGGGWYTEILANYIHYPGTLIAAHFNPDAGGYYKRGRENFEKKMNGNSIYGRVEIVNIDSTLADTESVDAVLTFRNLHNWLGPLLDTIFSNSYKALKPGGIFGVVEHRAKEGTSIEMMKKSGYVTEEHAINMAKKHGFELVSKSEINSNSKDSKDHPKGVWTLPPNLRMKELDKDKYLEIGESDRMTLLFKKPL
ncbi:MAG: methyltransferase [Gammaproteobacteria bacterium]|nr:methyltransferase [Gammaproteobacteria bacterium]|tara:strand:+ start:2321 stop:3103 length:783 start_codon:yes stop_codon:yes gene_type:complete